MKFETVVNGRAAKLTIEGARLRYEPERADVIEREFSLEWEQGGSDCVLASIITGGRSFEVLASFGREGSGNEILVNGQMLSVEVFDPRGMRGRRASGAMAGRQDIVAPMPGKVVRLLIAPGDMVEAGQGLIVVEAMKMQNEMKSAKPGRVTDVRAKAGAAVSAGQVLVVIE